MHKVADQHQQHYCFIARHKFKYYMRVQMMQDLVDHIHCGLH
jgi:hypothetical protein